MPDLRDHLGPLPYDTMTPSRPPLRRNWKAIAITIACLILAPIASAGAWAGFIQIGGNLHEVEKNQLYRSAQLSGPDFGRAIKQYGIRTIINLRGQSPNAAWYLDEVEASASAGVTHYDVALSAETMPPPGTLQKLIDLLKTSARPILVHCKNGADRAGLASALFELLVQGRPASEASGQLSFAYGHFPWLGSPTVAMDNTFAEVAAVAAEVVYD